MASKLWSNSSTLWTTSGSTNLVTSGSVSASTMAVFTGANWGSSTDYAVVFDPNRCGHCEEPLAADRIGKERFCSEVCEVAYKVTARLGGPDITHVEYGMGYQYASTMTTVSSRAIVNVIYSTNISS